MLSIDPTVARVPVNWRGCSDFSSTVRAWLSGGRALRYLSLTWDPDSGDGTYTVDYAHLLRDRDGSTRVVHDCHVEALSHADDGCAPSDAGSSRE